MGLTGDFHTLDQWERSLGELASPKLAFEVADAMADATLGLVAEEFANERDPYGKAWAPKKRPDGRMILRGKTGRLIKFRKGAVNQHGFRVDAGADYYVFNQPKRKMLPEKRLPRLWTSVYRDIFVQAVRAKLRVVTGGGRATRFIRRRAA